MRVEEPSGEQAWTTRVAVVGSGAGGGLAALTLAEAGIDVLVLEEGFAHTTFPDDLGDASRLLYAEGGMRTIEGATPAAVASGRALGGSTVVNSAISFRTPPTVLDEWNALTDGAFGDEAAWFALQDEVEALCGVARTPDALLSGCDRAHKAAARRMGWAEENLRRNTPGCAGCGRCNLGCPVGGKASTDRVALPRASAAGARIVTGCRVDRVASGRLEGTIVDRRGASTGWFTVSADRIVLAAGTIGTPSLLLASGLTGEGTVGTGLKLHPTAGAHAMLPHPVQRSGAAQGHGLMAFTDDAMVIESNPIIASAIFSALPFYGREAKEVMARGSHLVSTGGLIRDVGVGRVLAPDGGARVAYELTAVDRLRLIRLMRRGCQLWLEGADAEWTVASRHGARPCRSMDEVLRELPDDLDPGLINTYSSHPQSSCGIGRTCDASGEVRGHPGIHCMDASVHPNAVGRNPQITVMTVATLLARRLAAELGGSPRPL